MRSIAPFCVLFGACVAQAEVNFDHLTFESVDECVALEMTEDKDALKACLEPIVTTCIRMLPLGSSNAAKDQCYENEREYWIGFSKLAFQELSEDTLLDARKWWRREYAEALNSCLDRGGHDPDIRAFCRLSSTVYTYLDLRAFSKKDTDG